MPKSRKTPLLSWRNGAALGVVVVLVVVGAVLWSQPWNQPTELRLDQFSKRLDDGEVRTATVNNDVVDRARGADRRDRVHGGVPIGLRRAAHQGPARRTTWRPRPTTTTDPPGHDLLVGLLPTVLIVGVFIWFVNQMQGGKGTKFGRSRADG